MLKEHAKALSTLIRFFDIMLVGVTYFLWFYIFGGVNILYPVNPYLIQPYVYFVAVWAVFLHSFKLYDSFRVRRTAEAIVIVAKAALAGIVVYSAVLYLHRFSFISRWEVLQAFAWTAVMLVFKQMALIGLFRYTRHKGYNYKNLLIVGTGRRAQRFIDIVRQHSEWGFRIIGLVDEESRVGQEIHGVPVIGALQDIPNIIHNNVVDDVVFIVPRSWLSRIEGSIQFCEIEGLRVNIAVDHFDLMISRAKQTDLAGFPLITFESAPDKVWSLFVKRAVDIALSLSALVILSPVLLAAALAVKWTSPGPVFFRQERSGLNGRKFTLYKYRTMVIDAEARLAELLKHNEMSGPVFKMSNDPRITKVGAFLRKTSIDELPQLWNVFRGDMSLVGPRPPIPAEVTRYDSWHRRRLSMRPGLTCIWQVNGRNKVTKFDDWMKMDLEYIDNWSLALDCKIILKTVPAVLFGVGAK